MKGFSVLPNPNLKSEIANSFVKNYSANVRIGSMERKARILERFAKGEPITEDEAKEAEVKLVHRGFNVYEDDRNRIWWLENGVIYRPDDDLIYSSIEEYLKNQKIGTK